MTFCDTQPLQDLLTIRADRHNYYYGCDALLLGPGA